MNRYKLRKEDQKSIVVTRGTVQELPPGSDAGSVCGGAGLVKADGGAEPPRKIHLLCLGSLNESMDHQLLQVGSLSRIFN